MEYIIPAGPLAGRHLGTLSAEERLGLHRTRTQHLAQARALLATLDRPAPATAAEPEAILPLVLLPRRPSPTARWPPKPTTPWPAPSLELPSGLKVLAFLAILTLTHPPLACLPSVLIGRILRGLALRCREAANNFIGSIADQLGDLSSDLLAWWDSYFASLPGEPGKAGELGKPAPGQKCITFLFSIFFLRSIRTLRTRAGTQ
jgi:hypothetical protein